jgi:hypothetical protein
MLSHLCSELLQIVRTRPLASVAVGRDGNSVGYSLRARGRTDPPLVSYRRGQASPGGAQVRNGQAGDRPSICHGKARTHRITPTSTFLPTSPGSCGAPHWARHNRTAVACLVWDVFPASIRVGIVTTSCAGGVVAAYWPDVPGPSFCIGGWLWPWLQSRGCPHPERANPNRISSSARAAVGGDGGEAA